MKLLRTIWLLCVASVACNSNSISENESPKPILPPSNFQVRKPTNEEDRIASGQKIFLDTVKRFKFDYQKPIVNGLCVDVVVPFPKTAWNKLAKKEKVDLAMYAQNTISQVKSRPAEFVEMPQTAPLYETCLGNIAKLSSASWRIEVGSVVTIDGDTNIGSDAEAVVDGKSIDGFRKLNDK